MRGGEPGGRPVLEPTDGTGATAPPPGTVGCRPVHGVPFSRAMHPDQTIAYPCLTLATFFGQSHFGQLTSD